MDWKNFLSIFIHFIYKKTDRIYYLWKRNNWMLHPLSYFSAFKNVQIKGPIFLLGNQGDGLTLLSRILRRHSFVISATGNSQYWAGADEMANVYEPILPSELSGIRFKAPKHHKFTPPRSWSYACDELIDKYRKTEKDANKYLEQKLKKIIGFVLYRYGKYISSPRFVDKSQVYTVKMSLINELLKDCNPYFIFVTRNPYASCYRAAIGKAGDMKRYAKFMSLDERIKICIEHWINSIKCIEEDKSKVKNFIHIRFEDFLKFPKEILKKICDFVKLEYSDDMLPQSYHRLPFGVRFKNEKWYPIRSDVNKRYLDEIYSKYIDMIYERCGKYAELYGYNRPILK